MSRQKLGQHFLNNPAWQNRILDKLPSAPSDIWIEIGSGQGQLTRHLSKRARRLVAVETDPLLAENLRKEIAAPSHRMAQRRNRRGRCSFARSTPSRTPSRSRRKREIPRLREPALLHHVAHSPPSLPMGRPYRLNPHRHPTRSRRSASPPTRAPVTTAISPSLASTTRIPKSHSKSRPARFGLRQRSIPRSSRCPCPASDQISLSRTTPHSSDSSRHASLISGKPSATIFEGSRPTSSSRQAAGRIRIVPGSQS